MFIALLAAKTKRMEMRLSGRWWRSEDQRKDDEAKVAGGAISFSHLAMARRSTRTTTALINSILNFPAITQLETQLSYLVMSYGATTIGDHCTLVVLPECVSVVAAAAAAALPDQSASVWAN